jgi:hypothetical protein
MFPLGTAPLEVAVEKLHVVVNTTVPGGCSTLMVAEVKATSVIVSVH